MKPLRRVRAIRRRVLAGSRDALAELRARIVAPEVVFLGDSITQFWSDEDPALFGQRRLNRGISGETTREMRARFDADVIALRPRIVHLMAGTNDLWHGDPGPEATIALANLRWMVERAGAHGITVVLANPPPIAAYAAPLFRRSDLFGILIEGIGQLSRSEGTTHIDYADSLTDASGTLIPRYTTDGVHLTRAGYRAMRSQADRALQAALHRS